MSCHIVWHLATEVLAALPPSIKASKSTCLRPETGWAVGSSPDTAPKPPQLLHPTGGPAAWGTDWKGTCGVDQNISNKTFS